MKNEKLSLEQATTYEVEIIYKRPLVSQLYQITSSEDAVKLIRSFAPKDRTDLKEYFWVLVLNSANYVLGVAQIGEGTINTVVINLKEIYQLVIKTNASGIILAHNHPSGNMHPSERDVVMTKMISQGAQLFNAELIDHIIITKEGYYSFADECKLE